MTTPYMPREAREGNRDMVESGPRVEVTEQTKIRRQLLQNGYRPLANKGKMCVLKGWPRIDVDDRQIDEWNGMLRYRSTGIRIDGDLCVIDVDIDDEALIGKVWARTSKRLGKAWSEDVLVRGGKGDKEAWLFRVENGGEPIPFIPPSPKYVDENGVAHGVEIFTSGSPRQIGAFGWHTEPDRDGEGVKYEWLGDEDADAPPSPLNVPLADLPVVPLDAVKAVYELWKEIAEDAGLEQITRFQPGEWKPAVYDIPKGAGLPAPGTRLRAADLEWLDGTSTTPERLVVTERHDGVVGVHDFKYAQTHWPVGSEPDDPGEKTFEAFEALGARLAQVRPRETQINEMRGKLQVNGNGQYRANAYNAYVALTLHPDFEGAIVNDRFRLARMLLRPVPGTAEAFGAFGERPLVDEDIAALAIWLQGEIIPNMSEASVWAAVKKISADRAQDPLRQYVERCAEDWDDEERIERFHLDYVKAVEGDTPYARWLGEVTLMTLVLRAIHPGAFTKMVPIWEGRQNIGKSSAAAALCPDRDWFTDNLPPISTKDASSHLRGMWVVELEELNVKNKTEVEQLKGFITRRSERFRASYERVEKDEPRRCMFIGTTNADDYLKDHTGSTRFFPVEIEEVDVAAIERDRDQLVGEAAARLREALEADKKWWEPPWEAALRLEELRDEKREEDPWLPRIAAFVRDLDEVCTGMILDGRRPTKDPETGVVAWRRDGEPLVDASRQTTGVSRRVSACLQQLGWVRAGRMPHDYEYPRNTRFVRVADDEQRVAA